MPRARGQFVLWWLVVGVVCLPLAWSAHIHAGHGGEGLAGMEHAVPGGGDPDQPGWPGHEDGDCRLCAVVKSASVGLACVPVGLVLVAAWSEAGGDCGQSGARHRRWWRRRPRGPPGTL